MRKNRIASHSEIEKEATWRNGMARYSEREERLESINGDMSKVNFLDQGITKWN